MGGQGGGVLADWIVATAEVQGWVAQSTSVPGVAQRTGATIYYVEMLQARDGIAPILSLMPTLRDVDVVIAAELMEAGRSVMRGLVTPDRTTLIASTHRSFAIGEKEKPGDGIGNPTTVVDATDFAAKRCIAFDMEEVAVTNGSVISSALFGALAASGVLPFGKDAFAATIRSGGKDIERSLKTFDAAYERTKLSPRDPVQALPEKCSTVLPAGIGHPILDTLMKRIASELPAEAHEMLFAGVKKLTNFQDPNYAREYVDRVCAIHHADRQNGGAAHDYAFKVHAAKYVAVAMAYDDVIRVADLKVRGSRFARVRKEAEARSDQIVYTTEYMHPRMDEICGTLPEGLGAWIEARPRLYVCLDRVVSRGRRVRSGILFWFGGLYGVSALRRWRRATLRHRYEADHRETWLAMAVGLLAQNYRLAVEVVRCRRLVKGDANTHARGVTKFDKVLSAVPVLAGRDDGAAWLARLRQAALLDEDGIALDGKLRLSQLFELRCTRRSRASSVMAHLAK